MHAHARAHMRGCCPLLHRAPTRIFHKRLPVLQIPYAPLALASTVVVRHGATTAAVATIVTTAITSTSTTTTTSTTTVTA